MLIRLLEEEDIGVCGVIYSAAFSTAPYNDSWTPGAAEIMLEGLYERDPESCWCVEIDDEVVGFAFCTVFGSFRATIQEFAIASEYQKQGLGSALMEYILDRFRERGIAAVDLIANRNAPAYRLYRKFLFAEPENYRVMIRGL